MTQESFKIVYLLKLLVKEEDHTKLNTAEFDMSE